MEDEDLARAIAASLEDQKKVNSSNNVDGDQQSDKVPQRETETGGDLKAQTTANAGDEAGAAEAPKKKEETEEEIQARLKRKLEEVKKKKAEEEKEMERLRELERVRTGKEMLKQKRLLEDQERQRLADFRKREKEEKRRAKQAVLEQIARDKAERRSGLPPSSASDQEQKDNNNTNKEEKRERERGPFGVKPISTQTKVRDLLVQIKKTYSKERADTAFKTLNAYLGNLLRQPLEDKFRSIRASNNAFQQRIASLEGGEAIKILNLLGFDLKGEFYTLEEHKVNKLAVEGACGELHNAMNNPFFGVL